MGKVSPRIALVHDFLTIYGGAEMVLKELHDLFPSAPIYTAVADTALLKKHFPAADVRTTWLQNSWRRRLNPIFLQSMPRAVEAHDLTDYDIVLSSSGAFSHGVITGPQTTHISYCHSPMRYAWDWHSEFAEERGFHRNWLTSWIFEANIHNVRLWDAIAARRVDVWVANATTVRNRIKKFYDAEASVVYPPVDTEYYSPLDIPRKRVAFTVSRISSAKRIDQMIDACHHAGIPLRIAGRGDTTTYEAYATKLGADVTFLGPISDEEKRIELASASCFLFPAEDDFGIAPVEAMAMGTPVIAFGKGGATETVVHGSTGILYDEPTSIGLSEALTQFQSQTWDPTTIREQALTFSRERFRKAIMALINEYSK